MQQILIILDYFGVVVFAISGSLAAGRKQMDLFGVIVLACVTALGGGTIRDMILFSRPVFWVAEPNYLFAAAVAALVTFFSVRFFSLPGNLLLIADALGLAVFTVLGTELALKTGVPGAIAIVMGMITGTFGGILRDVLSDEIPLILQREIYATASLAGALSFWLLTVLFRETEFAVIVSLSITLGLRLAATHWGLSLPVPATGKRN